MKTKEMKPMKKWLVGVGLLVVPALFLSKEARADGNYSPVLVVSSTSNQGYLYSTSSASVGGVLVNNGGGAFNWSNQVSTTIITGIALQALTQAQTTTTTPGIAGQLIFCSNCTSSNVCVSSGTGVGAWVAISTNSVLSKVCN
jgi:hypothetical protein